MKDLLNETYQLLDSTAFRFDELASAAQVNARWLRYFANRRYPDPGVKKVQAVYNELARRNCFGGVEQPGSSSGS